MPPKAKKSAVILVGNIGSSSLDQCSIENEPFIDKMKYSMKLLIEKKIFLQPKDEIQIITMGDEETNNPEDIDFVKLYSDYPMVPNWEMVKYVESLNATNKTSNWIEALHVALEFKRREITNQYLQTIIVLFSNFKESKESIDNFDADAIIEDIQNNHPGVIILFIGENPINEKCSLSPSEEFVFTLMKKLEAQYEEIDNFIKMRRLFQPPKSKPRAWTFELQCAGVNIPCASYVKIAKSKTLGKWLLKGVKDSDDLSNDVEKVVKKDIVKEKLTLDHSRNEVPNEDIIFGYKFGGKYIPVTDDDQAAMKFTGSLKGMTVYGFVPQDEVKLEFWSGQGSRIIVPQTHKKASISTKYARAFYSLVKAMAEMKYAAIVRKVYQVNNVPKMGVLFPKLDDDSIWCLVHLELPFSENIKSIPKRSIKPVNEIVSEQQIKALDDFIDSMTIDDDDVEYLNPGKFPSIPQKYLYNSLSYRALNPNAPLLPPNDYLMEYLNPPENVRSAVQPHLEKLNKVFPIPKQEKKIKKENASSTIDEQVITKKDEEDVVVEESANQAEKSSDKNTNSIDDGFFSPVDVNFQLDDLGDM